MWTQGGSTQCDRGDHEACNGIARFVEQDGTNEYICNCHCHKRGEKS